MIECPFVSLASLELRRTDERGYLEVLYERGGVVLKRSFSRAGVFRGMHWQQAPFEQTKLIRIVSGRIVDFVLDPSQETPEVYYKELGIGDGWIEIGTNLAHGFYAKEDTEFEYFCHGPYNETAEKSYSIESHLRQKMGFETLILSSKDSRAKPIEVAGFFSV